LIEYLKEKGFLLQKREIKATYENLKWRSFRVVDFILVPT